MEIASKAENLPLCENKFLVFASRMESFAAALNRLFPEEAAADKQQGDKDFLACKIDVAVEYLDSFEDESALARLGELEQYTFGEETDTLLSEARSMIETFDYDKVVALLKTC